MQIEAGKSPVIDVRSMTKSYEGRNVIENVSFTIPRGEIFVIIGPSGAGKTTLLRLLDLLDGPSSGKIFFDGVDTTSLNASERFKIRRRVGMVFQNTTLFNDTVYANVAYGLRIREISKAEEQNRVNEALQVVGLHGFEDRWATTLSGGEVQRVAIARVLVYRPDLMLMDELTANLDPSNTVKIEALVQSIRERYGSTIVIATHNMFQAKRLGKRCALFVDGKIIELGETESFFSNPKEKITRAFLNGEMVY